MTAVQLLQLLIDGLFILVFLVVGAQAIREPRRARIDVALLFGDVALIILIGALIAISGAKADRWLTAVTQVLLMAIPYLLLRLVEDFRDVPARVSQAAIAGLALCTVSFFVIPPPIPGVLIPLYLAYFGYLSVYVAAAFIDTARSSAGVTKRRMIAVAGATLSLGLAIVFLGFSGIATALAGLWTFLVFASALGSGLGYFLGFAPPPWLRRAWQEPEIRAFFRRAAALPRLDTMAAVIEALQHGTAQSLGVRNAVIGLWDEQAGVLRFTVQDTEMAAVPGQWTVGKVFERQKPLLRVLRSPDAPDVSELARIFKSNAILAAPITAGTKRLGVLAAYAPRAPFFAEDDLQLVALLADQAAIVLDSRALIQAAAQVRVREEAARLKDEFLSVAAHDLKTPLTAVVAQAQLLERRARRSPDKPADLPSIQRLVSESMRLRRLVLEILDMARVEQGRLLGHLELLDLAQIAEEACAHHSTDLHTCSIQSDGPITGAFDRARISQLLDNLLENAVKYSPVGAPVVIRVNAKGNEACIEVQDAGIGIPAADLEHLFDRFHRASNAEQSEVTGLGLGLYICKGIVEQHGSRIWATSPGVDAGSTFMVRLPLRALPETSDNAAAPSDEEEVGQLVGS